MRTNTSSSVKGLPSCRPICLHLSCNSKLSHKYVEQSRPLSSRRDKRQTGRFIRRAGRDAVYGHTAEIWNGSYSKVNLCLKKRSIPIITSKISRLMTRNCAVVLKRDPIENVTCTVPGLSCFDPSPFFTAAETASISGPNSFTLFVEIKELLAPVSQGARYSSFLSFADSLEV